MASEDAAGQVGPLEETDGAAAMEARVIRRKRARRGVLGGVVVLAVLALVTVGAVIGGGKHLLPAGWGPSGDVPAGWTEVSEAGLTLAVPQGFEPYEEMGVGWVVEPEQDDEFGDFSAVIVQPLPLQDDHPMPETYGEAVETEVPGATSAEYAWQTADGLGDLEGALDVGLESGRTIRVMIVLADVPDPEGMFEQLVGTVQVDPSFDESTLAMPEDEQPVLDVVQEIPSGWDVQEHQGLTFAVPEDWVEDDTSAARDARWPAVSMNDAAGEFRLKVTALSSTFDSDEEHSYMYVFEPPPGADRAGAELTPDGGTLTAWLEVRKAGGRTYSIDIQVPTGEDGERLVNTVAGNLQFTAEADALPSYEDLEDAQRFVDDAPEIPDDWVVATVSGFSLRVPPELEGPGGGDDGEILLNSPSGVEPDESVRAWREDAGGYDHGEIPLGGFRLDLPGTDRALVRFSDYTEYGEADTFSPFAEVRLADGSYVMVSYDGSGPESEERFWQILSTLEVPTT